MSLLSAINEVYCFFYQQFYLPRLNKKNFIHPVLAQILNSTQNLFWMCSNLKPWIILNMQISRLENVNDNSFVKIWCQKQIQFSEIKLLKVWKYEVRHRKATSSIAFKVGNVTSQKVCRHIQNTLSSSSVCA